MSRDMKGLAEISASKGRMVSNVHLFAMSRSHIQCVHPYPYHIQQHSAMVLDIGAVKREELHICVRFGTAECMPVMKSEMIWMLESALQLWWCAPFPPGITFRRARRLVTRRGRPPEQAVRFGACRNTDKQTRRRRAGSQAV